jgi:hypothetical protein
MTAIGSRCVSASCAGIEHYDVLANPPTNDQEVGWLADAITDDVVAAVELSRDQKRAARQRWRERRKAHRQSGAAGH